MSGVEPPVGAASGSSAAVPSQQQQQEIPAAHELSDAIGQLIKQQQEITAAQAQLSDAVRHLIRQQQLNSDDLRGWVLLVASIAASITYSAGLNPPGGVWQADDPANGYVAGTPVLLDKFPRQYYVFFYCNSASFAASLAIILLFSTPPLYSRIPRFYFSAFVTLNMIAWLEAFVAGSWTSRGNIAYGGCMTLLVVGVPLLIFLNHFMTT